MYISWILKSPLLSGFLSVQLPSCHSVTKIPHETWRSCPTLVHEDGQVVTTRIEHATVSWRFLIFGWDSRWFYCLNDSTPINGLKKLVNWSEKTLPHRSSFTPIYTWFLVPPCRKMRCKLEAYRHPNTQTEVWHLDPLRRFLGCL